VARARASSIAETPHRNAIVMAARVSAEKPMLHIRPRSADEIIAELDAMQFRPIRRTSR
jgi:hypothetical protein